MVLSAVENRPHPYARPVLPPTMASSARPSPRRHARTNFHNIMDLVESKPQIQETPVHIKLEPQEHDALYSQQDNHTRHIRRILEPEYDYVTRDTCPPTSSSNTSPLLKSCSTSGSPNASSSSFSSSSGSPCRSPGSDLELSHGRRPSVDLSDCSPETKEPTDASKVKKGRTIYKAQQVFVLEQVFHRTQYPDPEVIETLAKDLNISEAKIKVWFQNKRARWRRRSCDPTASTASPYVIPAVSVMATSPTWSSPAHLPPTSLSMMPPVASAGLYSTHPAYTAQYPGAPPAQSMHTNYSLTGHHGGRTTPGLTHLSATGHHMPPPTHGHYMTSLYMQPPRAPVHM